ncbi:MAG: hypothetical protein ACXWC9_08790 [Pseudobdellovibrionaceae bacterium]
MPVDKRWSLDLNDGLVSNLKSYWPTFFYTLKRIGPLLFVLTICGTILDQWITSSMETMLLNPQGTSRMVWAYGALSLVWGVLYPLTSLLLILSCLQPLPLVRFWTQTFPQALIELMRAWGKSMLWSFLLIIPGILAFIRYLFVPFVVALDPLYHQGQREALRRSWALSKGRLGRLFGLFMLSSILAPALMTMFDEWKIFSYHPVSAAFICMFEMFVNMTFSLWLWKIYQRSVQNESSVSVEGH